MSSTNFALNLTKLAAKGQCWLSPIMVNFLFPVLVEPGWPALSPSLQTAPSDFSKGWVAASSIGRSGVSVLTGDMEWLEKHLWLLQWVVSTRYTGMVAANAQHFSDMDR